MRALILAALFLCLPSVAEARTIQPPDVAAYMGVQQELKVLRKQRLGTSPAPTSRLSFSTPARSEPRKITYRYEAREPAIVARFIGGRLICAANVNAELAARGIRGTGSKLAKSFLKWGRASGPVVGAVAVFNRGRDPKKGHVAIVSRIVNGKIFYLNPTRAGWREMAISKHPIAFRVAA